MAPSGYSEIEGYLYERWIEATRRRGYQGAIAALRSCYYGAVEYLGTLDREARSELVGYLFEDAVPSGNLSARLVVAIDSPGSAEESAPGPPEDIRFPVSGGPEFMAKLGSAIAAWRLNTFVVSPRAKGDVGLLSAYARSFRDGLAASNASQEAAFRRALAGRDPGGTGASVQTGARR